MTPFEIQLPAGWNPVPSEPPDVSATPQARLLAWTTFEPAPGGPRATVGCFGFQLAGYTDELAPIVFERSEPFAVRAAGGARPSSLVRGTAHLDTWPHRQDLQLERPDGKPVHATLAFGFAEGELLSCFAVCGSADATPNAACTSIVDSAQFTVPLTAAPAPSWAQSLALGVLAQPRPAALGLALALVFFTAVLLFSRGSRA